MKDLFHVDIATVVIVVIGLIATYVGLKKDSKWHTEWIKKHSNDCDEYRELTSTILTELRVTSGKMAEILSSQDHRVARLESQVDDVIKNQRGQKR